MYKNFYPTTCVQCKETIYRPRFWIKKHKFCSKKCIGLYLRKDVKAPKKRAVRKFICKGCKKYVEIMRKETESIYCSQQCFWKNYKPTNEQVESHRKKILGKPNKTKGLKRPITSGSKNGNWKGGITPMNHAIRTSLEYKLWRKAVYERDNYTCVWCGDNRSGNLEADHIMKFADYPYLRLEFSNGRTLCKSCHKKTKTYGKQKYLYATL